MQPIWGMAARWSWAGEGRPARVLLPLVPRKIIGTVSAGVNLIASLNVTLAAGDFLTQRLPLNRSRGGIR